MKEIVITTQHPPCPAGTLFLTLENQPYQLRNIRSADDLDVRVINSLTVVHYSLHYSGGKCRDVDGNGEYLFRKR